MTPAEAQTETLKHIMTVQEKLDVFIHDIFQRAVVKNEVEQKLLGLMANDLTGRAIVHDMSKLKDPEKTAFFEATEQLKGLIYGSKEYHEVLNGKLKEALEHHYKHNDHHPEFYENGIKGMNIFALNEMFCDWYAATERHADGDIRKSIEYNQKRFGYSDDLKQIFLNTVDDFDNKMKLFDDDMKSFER